MFGPTGVISINIQSNTLFGLSISINQSGPTGVIPNQLRNCVVLTPELSVIKSALDEASESSFFLSEIKKLIIKKDR